MVRLSQILPRTISSPDLSSVLIASFVSQTADLPSLRLGNDDGFVYWIQSSNVSSTLHRWSPATGEAQFALLGSPSFTKLFYQHETIWVYPNFQADEF